MLFWQKARLSLDRKQADLLWWSTSSGSPAEIVLNSTPQWAACGLATHRYTFGPTDGVFLKQPSFISILRRFLAIQSELQGTISARESKLWRPQRGQKIERENRISHCSVLSLG